jgi:hypothetical protein
VRHHYSALSRAFYLSFGVILLTPALSYALPEFLMRFSQDPFSRPEFRGQCSTCHINPAGGGPRNPFGAAFEENGKIITPALRASWPDRFLPSAPAAPVATPAGEVRATFLSSETETVLEIGGEYFRLNAKEATFERLNSQEAAQLLAAPPSVLAPTEEPRLPLRNQPTFDHYLVNLPTTLPYRRGGFALRFTHRFTQPVLRSGEDCPDCAGIADLFGFDSFSYSSFGGEAGLTSRLALSIHRSPLLKDYEFGGVLQLLTQGGSVPLSAALRASLQTRRIFSLEDLDFRRFQSYNLMIPVSRAVTDIAEIFVVPMAGFHVNPNADFQPPSASEGERRKHFAAIGLGASIRFRPRTAFIMDWTPRVAGFRPGGSRHSLSFGIQRTTNAHIFELTLSNSVGTTTSGAFLSGSRDLTLGFNLYRRLH